MEHAGKQQIIATVLSKRRLVVAHDPAAADHSNSAMEAQARGSYSAAADHSNSAMEAQASSSYPAAAAAAISIRCYSFSISIPIQHY